MTREGAVRPRSLSSRLLVLTAFFVMLGEVLIFAPSVARFRMSWFEDRIAAGRIAALALEASATGEIDPELTRRLLDHVGAEGVVLSRPGGIVLMLNQPVPPPIDLTIDLHHPSMIEAIRGSFATLARRDDRVLRVRGPAPIDPAETVELLLEEAPLRRAMWGFGFRVLELSIVLSLLTAALVYLSLHYMFVRPMRRVTGNMVAFRADPENSDRVIVLSGRLDEIGTAERELATMQAELASMLHQKNRLAGLGLAVSKINHDLRNLLASAQLFSDRLAKIPDPGVQRFAPKLMHALERAIAFCQSTLSYGRLQEPPPDRRSILLEPLVEEVHETLGLGPDAPIRWISAVERGLVVEADYDQLFRILLNLSRNAVQAMESQAAESRTDRDPGRDQIRITGRREGAVAVIEVSDTGPGFSEKAREHLFEAFQGSTRTGGTGLGLAIAAELVRAHGGEIRLVEGTIGATLRLTIPDRAVELAAHRGARAHAHG